MVEDISSVYDDVQIREWSQNIRQIKINELKTNLRRHEEAWKSFCRMTTESYYKETEPDYLSLVNRLKEKINILETK